MLIYPKGMHYITQSAAGFKISMRKLDTLHELRDRIIYRIELSSNLKKMML